MFTPNNKNIITKCYIDLYESKMSSDQWIDIFKLFDNNVHFTFKNKSLCYEYIDDILNYINLDHINYNFLHYEDLTTLKNIQNVIYNLNINVDGDLSLKYRKNDLVSRSIYYNLSNLDSYIFCMNIICDLYIDSDNIHDIHSTIRMLNEINIPCNIYFRDHKKSSYYSEDMCHIVKCVTRDISTRLIIDSILKDELTIYNKDNINLYYNTINDYCLMDHSIDKLSIDNCGNVVLCPNINKNLKLNIFQCINNNQLTDIFIENVKDSYEKYCMGCNFKQL